MKTDSMKNFSKQLIFMFMLMLCGTVTTFGQRNPAQQFYRDTLLPGLKAQHVRNFTVKGYDTWITDTGTTLPQLTCYRHYHVSDKCLAIIKLLARRPESTSARCLPAPTC